MMTLKKSPLPYIGIVLVVLLCSCSQPRVEVTGIVSFPDGTPLTTGSVKGQSEGDDTVTQITGRIGTDGSFSLYEVKPGDKIPAGKNYKIWVANAAEYPQHRTPPGEDVPDPPPIPLIGAKRSSPHTTDIKLEVPTSTTPMVFNITVEKP